MKLKSFSLATEQFPICAVSTEEFIHFLHSIISNEVSGHWKDLPSCIIFYFDV